jgi:hypothetical protein
MPDDADPLAFLLELNLARAAKEKAGERIAPPGLPLQEKDRVAFTTEDCIQPLGTWISVCDPRQSFQREF